MVSNLSMVFMTISMLISILMPIALAIYFYKKKKISLLAVLIGAIVFVVSQLLLRIPMLTFLGTQEWYKAMSLNIAFLAVFLGLTAGLFEEVARYIAMKYFMKNRLSWKNGLAFGIGHGGIEAIILVGMTILSNLILSFMINAGVFEATIGAQLAPEAVDQLKSALVNAPSLSFLIAGYERIMAMIIQIALSIIVLYSVKLKKPIYLLYAILLHGVIDSPLVILMGMKVNYWVMELYVTACAALGLAFIIKSWQASKKAEKQLEQQVELQ
ncbi:MAG: YhfC family glutamic-type intramembrane protease [Lutisporaceae bacterium]